jgi:hypothetical protein
MARGELAETIGGFSAIIAFFSIFGLVAGGFMFRDEARDQSSAAEAPQTITLAELLTKGPGDNSHVTVTRFEVGRDYVVSTKGAERITFMILRPLEPVPSTAQQILMVENRYLKTTAEADAVDNNQTITGIYSKSFNSTSRESRRLLEEKYPGLDFWNAPFLEVRQFRGEWYHRRAVLMTAISGAVFLSCVLSAIIFLSIAKRIKRRAASSLIKEVAPGSVSEKQQ